MLAEALSILAALAALLAVFGMIALFFVANHFHNEAERLRDIIERAEAELVGAPAPGNARARGRHLEPVSDWIAPR